MNSKVRTSVLYTEVKSRYKGKIHTEALMKGLGDAPEDLDTAAIVTILQCMIINHRIASRSKSDSNNRANIRSPFSDLGV